MIKKNRSILLSSIYFLVVIVVVSFNRYTAVEKQRCLYIYKKDKILSLFKVKLIIRNRIQLKARIHYETKDKEEFN